MFPLQVAAVWMQVDFYMDRPDAATRSISHMLQESAKNITGLLLLKTKDTDDVLEHAERNELLGLPPFAATLLLKAFTIAEHDRLLVQASGHTQLCQMRWLALGNFEIYNSVK